MRFRPMMALGVDNRYPEATMMALGMGNISTREFASLYDPFRVEEARRLAFHLVIR